MAFQKYYAICVALSLALVSFAYGAEQEYQRKSRDRHNLYRTRHHVDPLSASDDLNSRAIRCAQYYAEKGTIDHSCPDKNGAGENLWAQWGGSPSDNQAAESSTDSWYSEEAKHDYNQDWQPESGHFTQLVWKNSKNLGFGVARAGNMIVGCALYSPAGNMMGDFKNNVLPA